MRHWGIACPAIRTSRSHWVPRPGCLSVVRRTVQVMGRELWEAPKGPPPRPVGVPDRPPKEWKEYRSAQGGGRPLVWLWWDGRWADAVPVRGAGRDADGLWWYFVQVDGRLDWVHESRTAPWGPGPDAEALSARIRPAPED